MARKITAEDLPILGGMFICRPPRLHFQPDRPIGIRLMSDLHIGAAHTDYRLIDQEIAEAAENEDRVLLNGDILDLILPKDHKRYKPDAVHPRVARHTSQVNAAVSFAVEKLSPVAHLIDMIGMGNHEAATEKWHSVDPILLLLIELEKIAWERDPKHVIHYGGYSGFVDYRLQHHAYAKGCYRWVIYYHHGSGGAAPVTKGMIDFNRKDVFVDADLVWMGHKHNRWAGDVEKIRCPMDGDEPDVRSVRHVMTGAYFQTYRGQSQATVRTHGRRSNYAADAGMAPGGKGGARVLLNVSRQRHTERPTVTVMQ